MKRVNRDRERRTFDDPTLREIALQHGKSAAQVMLRWHLSGTTQGDLRT